MSIPMDNKLLWIWKDCAMYVPTTVTASKCLLTSASSRIGIASLHLFLLIRCLLTQPLQMFFEEIVVRTWIFPFHRVLSCSLSSGSCLLSVSIKSSLIVYGPSLFFYMRTTFSTRNVFFIIIWSVVTHILCAYASYLQCLLPPVSSLNCLPTRASIFPRRKAFSTTSVSRFFSSFDGGDSVVVDYRPHFVYLGGGTLFLPLPMLKATIL